jgi:hypothetical protein
MNNSESIFNSFIRMKTVFLEHPVRVQGKQYSLNQSIDPDQIITLRNSTSSHSNFTLSDVVEETVVCKVLVPV